MTTDQEVYGERQPTARENARARAMTTASRPFLIVALLLLTACATAPQGSAPNAATTTTDSFDFTVTAQPGTWRNQPQVEGYVHNKRDLPATRVILRVDALDAGGKVVTSDRRHMDHDIPPNDRVFYQVPVPGPSPAYRVQVDY